MKYKKYKMEYYKYYKYNIIIIIKDNIYEAWLQKDDICIMSFMFGISSDDLIYDEFLFLVKQNLKNEILIYKERYCFK